MTQTSSTGFEIDWSRIFILPTTILTSVAFGVWQHNGWAATFMLWLLVWAFAVWDYVKNKV
jgi:hypothetical protein